MSESSLHYIVDHSLLTRMNSEDYIRLFITDTLTHDYDNYAINWNSPWLNYCVFIVVNNKKNDNNPIPNSGTALQLQDVLLYVLSAGRRATSSGKNSVSPQSYFGKWVKSYNSVSDCHKIKDTICTLVIFNYVLYIQSRGLTKKSTSSSLVTTTHYFTWILHRWFGRSAVTKQGQCIYRRVSSCGLHVIVVMHDLTLYKKAAATWRHV